MRSQKCDHKNVITKMLSQKCDHKMRSQKCDHKMRSQKCDHKMRSQKMRSQKCDRKNHNCFPPVSVWITTKLYPSQKHMMK